MSSVLLELAYLPNIEWFRNFMRHEEVWIEREENFIKSSARNRCEIAGANGRQLLSIPVVGGRDHHQKYKDVKISYVEKWQSKHWQSIRSVYGSTPFFEFYAHKLEPFYEKKYELLFDFNVHLLSALLAMIKVARPIQFTSVYLNIPIDKVDLRMKKKLQLHLDLPHYYQIFAGRHGFVPNLSIIDLLFHLGPETRDYLLR